MLKFITTIFLVALLNGCSQVQTNPANRSSLFAASLGEYALRGNIADYDTVEQNFIQAARGANDAAIYALLSPLTKKDSSEAATKQFVEAMKEYFRDYESDLKCKSIVPQKDEYGNVGFLFYNAFRKVNGGGRAYVMALIKENDTVYVSIVLLKFDPKFHERCRTRL